MPRLPRALRPTLLLLALAGCASPAAEDEARAAVQGYLDELVAAYRASDERLVDALVTERQGRKLVGTIGVKTDAGLVLEARLLVMAFEGVRRDGADLLVDTREQWAYRDLSAETGQQVGDPSTDAYAVRYRLVREEGRLKVAEIEFREPPVVGRKPPEVRLAPKAAHGL